MADQTMTATTLRQLYIEAVNVAVAQNRFDLVDELAAEYAEALTHAEAAA